jgi:hypothetical protein
MKVTGIFIIAAALQWAQRQKNTNDSLEVPHRGI